MVAGKWVVQDRRVTTADVPAVLARARPAAERLWRRMADLG